MDEPQGQQSAASPDCAAAIAALRSAGADRFDPVRLHYIETLHARSTAHQGSVRRLLEAKLAEALVALAARVDLARNAATETIARTVTQHPQAAEELQRSFAAGDFKGVVRLAETIGSNLHPGVLRALVQRLEHDPVGKAGSRLAKPAARPGELKAVRDHRNTWSRMSADKQVTKALGQPPANAGPINSHMLVLRSLALMRQISPDYLNRFMSYVDTLLCLEQVEKDKPAGTKKSPVAKVPATKLPKK
ncbi:MAG: DUF2894 domain-containing protein [Herminiimonas sp.]|nr:DUF2894 domain-containing protein [Herminiimonas sp.]